MLPPTISVHEAAYYDVLEDWIFPGIPQSDYVNPLVAQIWRQNNINFGSEPILANTELVRRTRAVMQARSNMGSLEILRWDLQFRRRMNYVYSGFVRWLSWYVPPRLYWFMEKSELLTAAYNFVTSNTFQTVLFTASRVVSVIGFILQIYAIVNRIAHYDTISPELDEYLDALRPLPFIKDAKTKLKVHYLPVQDVRVYPYNPKGKKTMSFPHVKQDVMDADLHKLGNVLVSNGSVYKYPPNVIMYYEIVCEVEFEVDLSASA